MRISKSMCFLSICLIFTSCSDSLSDKLIGEWKLIMTKSDCSSSQEYNDEETLANDGCIIQTTTSNSGLETNFDFCSILLFSEDGTVDVVSGDSQELNTETFSYEISSNIVSICTTTTSCNEYDLNDGQLINRFRVFVSGVPFYDCTRTFTYQKSI